MLKQTKELYVAVFPLQDNDLKKKLVGVSDCTELNSAVVTLQGAPLSEYTLRLIGSDLEHYIRKLLYDGEIKYNMRYRVLNFSMGKPHVKFNSS